MHVQILGPITKDAEKLLQNTAIAAKKLKLKVSFEKVNDFRKAAVYGIMAVPALVVDGQLLASGTVLNIEQAIEILKTVM